jgi:DNA polymerase-3 subunit chi
MSRIDFYHLKKQSLDSVLPVLLQKAYSTGKKVMVKTTEDTVETVNEALWTYNDESFLPHGSKKDGFAEEQPIYITSGDDNQNEAKFLFLINGTECDCAKVEGFERIFNIFDGNSEAALEQARNLWKTYKNAGFEVCYWQQTPAGKWEQKA